LKAVLGYREKAQSLMHCPMMIRPITNDQVKEVIFTSLHRKSNPKEYRSVPSASARLCDTLIEQGDHLGSIKDCRLDSPIDGCICRSECRQVLIGIIGCKISALPGTDALVEQIFQ
jgi:hypothetical protein